MRSDAQTKLNEANPLGDVKRAPDEPAKIDGDLDLKRNLKMSKVKTIHCSEDGRGVFQGDRLQQNQKN